jgi:hypothetical protein
MRLLYHASLCLLLCSSLSLEAKKQRNLRDTIADRIADKESEYKIKEGTIRKYLWYLAGIVGPQFLAKAKFCSPEGANLCSVGHGMAAIGDIGDYPTVEWLGTQAIWGSIAHELLLLFTPLKSLSNNAINSVHGFLGNITGNQVNIVDNPLNHTIATISLGNLLKKLAEYW